jgi:hypothetical protein
MALRKQLRKQLRRPQRRNKFPFTRSDTFFWLGKKFSSLLFAVFLDMKLYSAEKFK